MIFPEFPGSASCLAFLHSSLEKSEPFRAGGFGGPQPAILGEDDADMLGSDDTILLGLGWLKGAFARGCFFSTLLLLEVCVSNSCIGESTNALKNLDRTKGASLRSTSKAKKQPLAKAPFRHARNRFRANGRHIDSWMDG